MIIGVQGTKNFNDYPVFLRAMGTAMSSMSDDDKQITIFAAGPYQINAMVSEFCNISERSLKARGIKIKFVKVAAKWVETNITKLNYFIFLSKPKEPVSKIVELADAKNIDVGVYRY